LILLAFLLPLGIYLVILGAVNRRRHPLVVSGIWDFIGLLFAASGFLLFGGPAILSGLNENWRMLWLTGRAPGANGGLSLWAVLSALYFALVVGGATWLLRRRRHLTAIYNVEPAIVEKALLEACDRLGLCPDRSGKMFLFGLGAARNPEPSSGLKDGIQPPHYLPSISRAEAVEMQTLRSVAAILELDSFAMMNHVTLRWDPADPPLRPQIEGLLAQRLSEIPGPDSELGGWLVLIGSTLIFGTFLGVVFLVALRFFGVI
jgi:hypothetical protein